MVVGFVLEHEDPVLFFAVDVHLDLDGAGVDLLALVEIWHEAALFEHLGANSGHIHERHVLFTLLINLCTGDNIFEPGGFNGACQRTFFNIHRVQLC